jgi:Tol biopolymer transport system component
MCGDNRMTTTMCQIVVLAIVALLGPGRAVAQSKGLYRINTDGSDLRLIVPMDDQSTFTSPQESPDGKLIAYDCADAFNEAGQPDPARDHIFVVPVGGGKPKDLGNGMLPSWSPDSKQICFTVAQGTPGEESGLYVMNADGGGRQRLLDALAGRWSPDGSRMGFFAGDEVHVYDWLAGTTTRLTSQPRHLTGTPAWSSDGKAIAVVYFSDADHSLGVLDAEKESQEPRVLWEGHGISRSPNWAPSKKILVYATPNRVSDIYTLNPSDAATTPERPVEGKIPFTVKDPAWSRDGKAIVFIKPR